MRTDTPLSRRIVRSFLGFLNSVELSSGVDAEALDVARDCLSEVFQIDKSSLDDQSSSDCLVKIFESRDGNTDDVAVSAGVTDQPASSMGNALEENLANPQPPEVDMGQEELHSSGGDELFGTFFDALEKNHYFRRLPDGNDDLVQLDRVTHFFHNAVKEMEIAGCQTFDKKTLADTFKSLGNRAMQSKVYSEAVDLYTFAIALSENNAVYYCNRAAAYTQVKDYAKAVQDCLKSIEINPNYSKAYSRLGFAYYAEGKYRDAIDKGFKKALQLDPDNESVKENIRVAEQKLREEGQARGGSGHQQQSSSSSSHQQGGGEWSSSSSFSAAANPFGSIPADISRMFMSMGDDDPGIRVGGNFNVNDLPHEFSGAFRSMMGMFSGAGAGTQQTEQQEDDADRRTSNR
ncbi:hypothetical protein M569_04313 [Genlisea aurea]|uniref:SGTA homodimerisation domain-containing protein n=1 Tax=Genlisea aurea TaxID=192259 RepID=S8ED45_9LAMI|nr:hypothetical protein M569_04313 [Genlisea aurea]